VPRRNQEEYQTLGWIINKAESGLFLVVANEEIQREIVETYRGGKIEVYDYKQHGGEYSFRVLEDWIEAAGNSQTFFLVNFHLALQSDEDLSRLNFSRDMLAGLGKNLIFFTTPQGDDRLATGAYDFYSFLKVRMLFHGYAFEEKKRSLAEFSEGEAVQQKEERSGEEAKRDLREAYCLVQNAKEDCDRMNYRKSVESLLQARRIYEERLGAEHLETASVYMELANVYEKQYEYEKAEELCRKALEIRRKILGEVDPDIAGCYNLLARIYKGYAKYREAEELYQKAVAMSREMLGEEHPSTNEYLNNLAVIYEIQGKHQKAETIYKQIIAVAERVLGERDANTAVSYNNLALLYLKQEHYEEAERLLQKALGIREEILAENHPETAANYMNLAVVYERQRRYKEAEKMYQTANSLY